MKKNLIAALLFFLSYTISFSQKINTNDLKLLREKEDSLKVPAANIIGANTPEERFAADSSFTKMFVRALKINNSFYYPFDSLASISKLVPPDSSFKIFTWQLNVNEDVTRQHGAIQLKTNDGALKLIPLIDRSDNTKNIIDTVGNNLGWIGAVYYQLIQKQAGGKTYYTLLGYDENNANSTRKMIEVLSFENGAPVFGGKYFTPLNEIYATARNRFVMEYKKNAGPRLTYDKDMDMIVYEHLISETNEPQKKYTYIPDGDYEGFKWKNGTWVHIDKLFTQTLKNGQEPLPNPVLDDKGNIDETKLKISENPETQRESNVQEKPAEIKVKSSGEKTKVKKKL